jgi:hypothetical protein
MICRNLRRHPGWFGALNRPYRLHYRARTITRRSCPAKRRNPHGRPYVRTYRICVVDSCGSFVTERVVGRNTSTGFWAFRAGVSQSTVRSPSDIYPLCSSTWTLKLTMATGHPHPSLSSTGSKRTNHRSRARPSGEGEDFPDKADTDEIRRRGMSRAFRCDV